MASARFLTLALRQIKALIPSLTATNFILVDTGLMEACALVALTGLVGGSLLMLFAAQEEDDPEKVGLL